MNLRVTLVATVVASLSLTACTTPKLAGTVSGTDYTGARRDYSVPFPVSTAIGGRVAGDDMNGVTFTDQMKTRISFYSYEITADSPINTAMKVHGREAALANYVALAYHTYVPPHYRRDVCGGAVSFAFVKHVNRRDGPCGAAAFIHGSHLYVVESEPSPAALFLGNWDKKPKEQLDNMLEARAMSLLQTIRVAE